MGISKHENDVDVLDKQSTDTKNQKAPSLIVHNDDVNTFENVIITLIEVCGHSFEQAEQCALIIHNNGKCNVKSGDLEELIIMKEQIESRGITATVELN
jgi:ATP-dependent Clp protease adaptor protein ClpS